MAKTLLIIKLLLALALLPVSQSFALSQTALDPTAPYTRILPAMADCEQMGSPACSDIVYCPATGHSGCDFSGQLVLSAQNHYLGDNANKLSINHSNGYLLLLIETLLRPPRNT